MDTNRVEARFADGTTLAIEDEHGNTPADWKKNARPPWKSHSERAFCVFRSTGTLCR